MTALARRQCGPCTACCVSLQIEDPALHKKADVPCRHLGAGGCAIYDNRPQTCREFLCGWRMFAELDDGWRPDLAGIMVIRKGAKDLPESWRDPGYGVLLVVIGGERAVTRAGVAEYIAGLLRQGVAVLLAAASPTTLLNEHMEADVAAVRQRLPEVFRLVAATRWRWKPLMIAPLYRLQLDRQHYLVAKKLREEQP